MLLMNLEEGDVIRLATFGFVNRRYPILGLPDQIFSPIRRTEVM